jgi:hypothetical protein
MLKTEVIELNLISVTLDGVQSQLGDDDWRVGLGCKNLQGASALTRWGPKG